MNEDEQKKGVVTFRVPPELRDRIDAAAKKADRSVSNWVRQSVVAELGRLESGLMPAGDGVKSPAKKLVKKAAEKLK